MSRCLLLILCLVLIRPSPARAWETGGQSAEAAKGEIRDLIYIGGSAKVPAGKLAVLDVSDEQVMRIAWEGGNWELPYSRVQTLYVTLSRPSALVELAALHGVFLLGALRGRKGYLSLRYEEPDATSRTCSFLIPHGGAMKSVEKLASKSGRNIVFESEEARRRLQGRE